MAVETLRENTFSHSGDQKTFYWVSPSDHQIALSS